MNAARREQEALPATKPAMPGVHAPTTEWFIYYRQMIEFQGRELERLRHVEAAALRVASARRNGVVRDQGPLDALDAALEGRL